MLFECDGATNLEVAPVNLVNKELVQEYLGQKKHIPHIQKMQSTEGLKVTQK